MSITIPTLDGPLVLWEPELDELRKEHPEVDVDRELQAFAAYIGKDESRKRSASIALRGIHGWLKRAQRTTISREKPKYLTVEEALSECLARHLVPGNFKPAGETEEDQMASLKAMATCGWYRQNPEQHGDSGLEKSQRLLWYLPEQAAA